MRHARLAALIVFALSASLLSQSNSAQAADRAGLSSLPANARGPVSASLGQDDAAYWIHPYGAALRGENPRHGLVADFTPEGVEVRSHDLRWGLAVRGYGYGDAVRTVEEVSPHAMANRVEYRRSEVMEWYENGPLGLEQGFTLAHRPGKANGDPLTVELRLRGELVASVDSDRKTLKLSGKDGKEELRYTGLTARDATGRGFRSWLEVRGERLLVRVEDGEARYPLVIDPFVQQTELTASDGAAFEYFGYSVAVSGSTAVVGAPYHTVGLNPVQGAAYVFVLSGGTWSQQAELTASDGAEYDQFGVSVAVSGSTAVVGAAYHTVGLNPAQGAAYVFVLSGGTWSQRAELTSSDGRYADHFAFSVAVSGSTAVVGAIDHYSSNPYQGAAYVFVGSGGTWSQRAELTSSDGAANDAFGGSVAISGSTAVVGASGHRVGSNGNQGAAYVYVGSGGAWSQQAELTASDGTEYAAFGGSVAISGTTIVVEGFNGYQGAAYVFVGSGGTWSQQAELTAADGAANDAFGASVAINGNTAVVGAPFHTVGSTQYQGAAYMFVSSGGTWSQQAELTASDGAANAFFGTSVAVSGGTAVVGAPNHTVGSNLVQGAAYVFPGGIVYTCDPSIAISTCNYLNTTVSSYYSSTFLNAKANIYITYGNTALGVSSQIPNFMNFSQYLTALTAIPFPSMVQTAAISALNTYDVGPYGANYVEVTSALGAALGQTKLTGIRSDRKTSCIIGAVGCYNGVITITNNPNIELNYDDQGGTEPDNAYDFYAIVQHETDEILGTRSCISTTSGSLSDACGTGIPSAVDLFRYSAPGTLVLDSYLSTAPGAYFSYNGGSTNGATGLAGTPKLYNTLATQLLDYADFLSSSPNCGTDFAIQDARFCAGLDGGLNILDDGRGEINILNATGYSLVVPPLTLSPVAINFGNVVYSAKTQKTANLMLTNTGSTTVGFGVPSIVGIYGDPSQFGFSSGTCGSKLAPGTSCTASVTYYPDSLGTTRAMLETTTTSPAGMLLMPLTGTSLGDATLVPLNAGYANPQKVGTTSPPKNLILTNNSAATLTNIAIATTGDFAVWATNCGTSLAPSANCTISVTFTPTATGARTGQLMISDSANNSPQTSNLTGTGQ